MEQSTAEVTVNAGAQAPARRRTSLRASFHDASGALMEFMFNRWVTLICLIGLVLGLALPKAGLAPPSCSLLTSAGVPCPSCGLTRATTCALQGEFYGAWLYHPFGFGVAAVFLLFGPVALLPEARRDVLKRKLRPHQSWFGIIFLAFMAGVFAYGITRAVRVQADEESLQWWVNGGTPAYMVQHYGPAPQQKILPGLAAAFASGFRGDEPHDHEHAADEESSRDGD